MNATAIEISALVRAVISDSPVKVIALATKYSESKYRDPIVTFE